MKKLLSTIVFLGYLFVFANKSNYSLYYYANNIDTFINKQTVSSASTLYKPLGGLRPDSALIMPPTIFADTTAANFSKAAGYSGSIIQVAGGQIWYRTLNPNKWILFGASGVSGITSLTQGYGSLFSSNPITTTGTIGVDTTTIIPYTDTLKINGIATKSDIRNGNFIINQYPSNLSLQVNAKAYADTLKATTLISTGNTIINGLSPILNANYPPAEIISDSLYNGYYNAFGQLGIFPNGVYEFTYRRSRSHVGGNGTTNFILTKSYDKGRTWSSGSNILSNASYVLGGASGGITQSGRQLVIYSLYDSVTATYNGIKYIYSDNQGITYSSPQTFTNDSESMDAWGSLTTIDSGYIMQPWYGFDGVNYNVYISISKDDGITWQKHLVATSTTQNINESGYAYLGGGTIIGLIRNDNSLSYKQVKSTDNGYTWTDQGGTSFGLIVSNPPTLCTFLTPSGRRIVECYYRSYADNAGVITTSSNVIYAYGDDLINGASGWQVNSIDTIGNSVRGGKYFSVVHPYNSPAGIVSWYNDSLSYPGVPTGSTSIQFVRTPRLNAIPYNSFYGANLTVTDTSSARIFNGNQLNISAYANNNGVNSFTSGNLTAAIYGSNTSGSAGYGVRGDALDGVGVSGNSTTGVPLAGATTGSNDLLQLLVNGAIKFNVTNNGSINTTNIVASGTISVSGMSDGTAGTDSVVVHDNTTKQLKKISPNYYATAASVPTQYWQRSSTILSPLNSGDKITTTTTGGASIAIEGISEGTGVSGSTTGSNFGVTGNATGGSGIGVQGTSTGGSGVVGISTNSTGVFASTSSNAAPAGISRNYGTFHLHDFYSADTLISYVAKNGLFQYSYNLNSRMGDLSVPNKKYVDSLHTISGVNYWKDSASYLAPATGYGGRGIYTTGRIGAGTDIGVTNTSGASNLLYARGATDYTGVSPNGIASSTLSGGTVSTFLGLGTSFRNLNIYSPTGNAIGIDTNTISFFQPTSGTRSLRLKSASITDGLNRTQTFQDATGTIALTSDLPSQYWQRNSSILSPATVGDKITTTTTGGASIAIEGISEGTGVSGSTTGNNFGVTGNATGGSGIGVQGTSTGGSGVVGISTNSTGVFASTSSNAAPAGISRNYGTFHLHDFYSADTLISYVAKNGLFQYSYNLNSRMGDLSVPNKKYVDSLHSISGVNYWKDSSNYFVPNTGYGNRGLYVPSSSTLGTVNTFSSGGIVTSGNLTMNAGGAFNIYNTANNRAITIQNQGSTGTNTIVMGDNIPSTTSFTLQGSLAVTGSTITTIGNIQGATITATGGFSGTLTTAAQPNITSLGTQSATLNMGGNHVSNAGNISGAAGTFSGLITSTMGNNANIFNSASATTGFQYGQIHNTTGWLAYGILGSTANQLVSTATAYSSVIYTNSVTDMVLATNATTALTINGSDQSLTASTLSGSGSRAVFADANGKLSAPVSDSTVKDSLVAFGYGINSIMKLTPKWGVYKPEWKNYGEGRQNFLIAQDVQQVIPEAVFLTPSTGKLGINKDQLDAVYVQSLQDLQHEFQDQQIEIKYLRSEINRQQKQIEELIKLNKK